MCMTLVRADPENCVELPVAWKCEFTLHSFSALMVHLDSTTQAVSPKLAVLPTIRAHPSLANFFSAVRDGLAGLALQRECCSPRLVAGFTDGLPAYQDTALDHGAPVGRAGELNRAGVR